MRAVLSVHSSLHMVLRGAQGLALARGRDGVAPTLEQLQLCTWPASGSMNHCWAHSGYSVVTLSTTAGLLPLDLCMTLSGE